MCLTNAKFEGEVVQDNRTPVHKNYTFISNFIRLIMRKPKEYKKMPVIDSQNIVRGPITCYKNVSRLLRSEFKDFKYYLGKEEVLEYPIVINNCREVNYGFHSFTDIKHAEDFLTTGQVILECEIPVGAKLYSGYMNNSSKPNYVSNIIKPVKIVKI